VKNVIPRVLLLLGATTQPAGPATRQNRPGNPAEESSMSDGIMPANAAPTAPANPAPSPAPSGGSGSPGAPSYTPEQVSEWKRGHEQYTGFAKGGWDKVAAMAGKAGLSTEDFIERWNALVEQENAQPSQPQQQPQNQPPADPLERPMTLKEFQQWQAQERQRQEQESQWKTGQQSERDALTKALREAGLPTEGPDFEEFVEPVVSSAINRALQKAGKDPSKTFASAEEVAQAMAGAKQRFAAYKFEAVKAAAQQQTQTASDTFGAGAAPANPAPDYMDEDAADQLMQECMNEVTGRGSTMSGR
jgi:hypothetical protein